MRINERLASSNLHLLTARIARRPAGRARFLLGALGALMLLAGWTGQARAAHFRYGTLAWTVPDPVNAPRTVEFSLIVGLTNATAPALGLIFGDGTPNGTMAGSPVGAGIDSLGAAYRVFQYTTTHTYASDGPFTAAHDSAARVSGLVNGSNSGYRVQAVVALGGSPVNTGGPTTGSPSIIMLQAGAVRSFTWPAFEPDGDAFSCRFGTNAESKLPVVPTDQTVPAVPVGGAQPTLASVANGCTMTWDLTSAVAGQQYVVHLEFESQHGGVTSASAVDTIVQITSSPPPVVTGGGVLSANVGVPISVPVSATWTGGVNATVSTIGLPAGATLTPGGTAASPFANTLDWTPAAADRGKTRLVLINYTTSTNLVGTGFALITVSSCVDVCSGAKPFCDPIGLTCVACLSDAACSGAAPRCSASRTCVACLSDGDCAANTWCNDLGGSVSCDALTANGQPVPGGTCTEAVAERACLTEVCDDDDLCGWADGTSGCTPSTSTPACRSGQCDADGKCAPLPPAAIAVSAGSGQSTTVGTGFPTALRALVTNTLGQPVEDATVTFSVAASGASATLDSVTAVTDVDGIASVTATASTVAGAHTITASVAGVATTAAFSLTNLAGPAAAIAASSGDGQTQTIEAAFPAPLVVLVTDAHQNAVPGATVTFTAPAAGASATLGAAGSAVTDAAGRASVTATANRTAGAYGVGATVAGVAAGAAFGLTNTAGPPASITVVEGSGQSAVVAQGFTARLKVRVRDAADNVVPSAQVTFTAPGSGARASLSAQQVATDAQGEADVGATAGTGSGEYQVGASVAGATPASFSLTNLPGAPATVRPAASGTPQSATVRAAFGAPLAVTVLDGFDNPVPGASVQFAAPASGPTAALSATSALSGGSGGAEVTATASPAAGSYTVTATVEGASAATFSLVNLAGSPSLISAVTGTPQTAEVDATFGASLVVLVRDADDNPVPGATVTFAAPDSGASATISPSVAVTGADGQVGVAVTAGTIAGAYLASATVAGGAQAATFALTNSPGAAASVTASGASTPQSAQVGTAYVEPLAVAVEDRHSNPVPGVQVTFAVPASGATAVPAMATVITGAAGDAATAITAGQVVGDLTATASVAGVAVPAAFALRNLAGPPSTIAVESGSAQAATVGIGFGAPLVVIVRDAYGNLVPAATVTFTVPAAGASATLAAASATTGSDGLAQVTAQANLVAGRYEVRASTGDSATPATFALTNDPGAPATLTPATTSTPQSAQVLQAFAQPLRILVADAHGNPVPGVTVRFASPAAVPTATLSATEAVTGPDGLAQVSAVATARTGSYPVTARIDALAATAAFALTNTVGPPAMVVLVSGGAQHTRATTAFSGTLVLQILDGSANDVAGAAILLSAPASGASLTGLPASVTTDASGRASLPLTANAVPGTFQLTATVTGAAAPLGIPFTVEAIPTSLTLTGVPETAVANTPLSVTATVSAELGAPAGEITLLLDGQNEVGRASLIGGSATVSLAIPRPGTYYYSARFAAQGPHGASQSVPAQIVVTAAPDPNAPYKGAARVGGGGGGCALASGPSGGGGLAVAAAVLALLFRRRRRGRAGNAR